MSSKSSNVWFLPWGKRSQLSDLLSAAGLPAFFKKDEFVAIKAHFGEKGNNGYIKPKFFKPIITLAVEARTRPFLTDTNTIYHGERNNTIGHLATAHGHGFSIERLGIPIVIADGLQGENYEEIKVDGRHFEKVKIARTIIEADTIIAVSHFKGHLMAGFGGAIKNIGMGCGARRGKFEMHSTVAPTISLKNCTGCGACIKICSHGALKIVDKKVQLDNAKCAGCGECIITCGHDALRITWSESWKNVQEKFAEYACGAVQGKKLFCITFVNHITPNCDCVSMGEEPLTADIGILASQDPVAIDQAALDLVLKSAGHDVFKKAHPHIDHNAQLVHAEMMGLGSRTYELVGI